LIKEIFLDFLFPRRCPVCGEITSPAGSLICPSCFLKLSFVKPPVCKKCGKEIMDETMEYCSDCMGHFHAFESGVALLNYDETARTVMAQIKYKNKREYLDFFGAAMAKRYGMAVARMAVEAIVPVPVHLSRRRARGFNQAEELALRLSKGMGIPVCADVLARSRKTAPQKGLTPQLRLKNLEQAFSVREEGLWPGMDCALLVDDIYTTGSTAEACARVLKRAGIKKVYVLSICIGGDR